MIKHSYLYMMNVVSGLVFHSFSNYIPEMKKQIILILTMCSYNFFLAEDPSENYIKLRDFVLVKLCQDLLCFSPGKLMQGFSQEMVMEAQQKLKINKVLNLNSASWTYSYQASTT